MTKSLSQIEQRVYEVYKQYPESLDLDKSKRLLRFYWKLYDHVVFPLTEEQHDLCTPSSSILRARRKIREQLGLTDKKTEQLELDYAEHYRNKELY